MGSIPMAPIKRNYDTMAEGERNCKCTPWMTAEELGPFCEEGDLVEFDRDMYQHWGVFVQACPDEGVYEVIHLSGDLTEEVIASLTSKAGKTDMKLGSSLNASLGGGDGQPAVVQISDLKLVAGGRRCRVNNGRDSDFAPFPPEVIVSRALRELNKRKYNALFTNCEHFSTWCRYGTKSSRQSTAVKAIATGIFVGVATWSGTYAALGAAAYGVTSRLGHRILNRYARGRIGW